MHSNMSASAYTVNHWCRAKGDICILIICTGFLGNCNKCTCELLRNCTFNYIYDGLKL